MDQQQVESILAECERSLAEGGRVDLGRLGFWRAVSAVKRRPDWVDRYADRIRSIDRQVFERAVRPTFPIPLGAAVLTGGTLAGMALVAAGYAVPQPWNGLALLAGAGALLGATHDLGHLVVGNAVSIRFSHWFLDGPARVQPGLKTDYASYLRTPPRARAWMHASGALVTKVMPFVLLPVSISAQAPFWTTLALLGIGAIQIATDVLYSVRASDWKRFRREMRVARDLERRPT